MPTNPSLAPRLPGLGARHAVTRARHVRWSAVRVAVIAVLVLAVAAVATVVVVSRRGHTPTHAIHASVVAPTVISAVAPWQLRAPVGAEVVLPATVSAPAITPAPSTLLDVFGGSTTGNRPADGIFSLDLSTGSLVHVGNLQTPLADAAGAAVGGRDLVFGGDMPVPVSTVQALPGTGPTSGKAVPLTTVVGSLPEPRAGAGSATVGSTTYIVGGADGTTPEPSVLATRDGHTYTVVATLRVAVAYPAVAAVGRRLYVFGGQALTGPESGQPVGTIQVIDPAAHAVTLAGRLPDVVAGAAAFTLAGHVFIAGGDTTPVTAVATTTSAAAAAGAGATATFTQVTSAVVWAFDPTTLAVKRSGSLQVPVSHAGVAVLGTVAWLVGGTTSGAPVATVQNVTYVPPSSGSARSG